MYIKAISEISLEEASLGPRRCGILGSSDCISYGQVSLCELFYDEKKKIESRHRVAGILLNSTYSNFQILSVFFKLHQ